MLAALRWGLESMLNECGHHICLLRWHIVLIDIVDVRHSSPYESATIKTNAMTETVAITRSKMVSSDLYKSLEDWLCWFHAFIFLDSP